MASDGTGALIINQASVSDQAYYQCFAFNEHGVSLSVKTHLIAALLDDFPDSMEIRVIIVGFFFLFFFFRFSRSKSAIKCQYIMERHCGMVCQLLIDECYI